MKKTNSLMLLIPLFVALPFTGLAQTSDEYLEKAQAELDLWNPAAAIEYLDKALELAPNNAQIFFLRATAKRDASDLDGALQDFNKAIENDSAQPAYYHERGMLRNYLQDYPGAVDDLNNFLKLDLPTEQILRMRGESKYGMHDFTGAVADYTKAIMFNPKNPELYYLRAFARTDSEDFQGAVQDFTKVMEMQPLPDSYFDKQEAALVRRAGVNLKAANYAEAIADCNLAIERNTHDLEAFFIRGMAQTQLENFQEAIKDFDLVIAKYPLDEAYHYRGKARLGAGDQKGAQEDFQKAAEMGFKAPPE